MNGPALLAHFANVANIPNIAGAKFRHDNQILFYFIRDPQNVAVLEALNKKSNRVDIQLNPMVYHHELHIHYAGNGNGKITGANLRAKGGIPENSIPVETHPLSPIIQKCLDLWYPANFNAPQHSNHNVINW